MPRFSGSSREMGGGLVRPDDRLARFEEVRRAEQLYESAAEMLMEQYI
jgi:hypothetical protein